MDFVTKSFGKVFNWSEFHLSQMTLLQNPYFSSNNMCTMILKGVFLEYWQQNFFFFCLEYDLSKVNFNSSFFVLQGRQNFSVWSDIFYYGKTWKGKNWHLQIWKKCHLKWKKFTSIDILGIQMAKKNLNEFFCDFKFHYSRKIPFLFLLQTFSFRIELL